MTAKSANHLPLPELDYSPRTIEDIAQVIVAAMSIGVNPQTARGLGAWLVVRHSGLADDTGDGTRSRYRKILKRLADGGLLPEPPLAVRSDVRSLRRAARRSSAGGASTLAVALVLVGAWAFAENNGSGQVTLSGPDADLIPFPQASPAAADYVSDTSLVAFPARAAHVLLAAA